MIYLNKKPLLEDSFNSFVRSVNLAFTLTEATHRDPNQNRNRESERENKILDKMLSNHYNDIKDLKKTTQGLQNALGQVKLQNQFDKELSDKKTSGELGRISYEPVSVVKQIRPFTSYKFPFNIIYLVKQIFIWVGNFLTRAFAKIAEMVASLTGNKMQTTIALSKDAFVKDEEFMRGTYIPMVFNTEKSEVKKMGNAEIITYGSRINDNNRLTMREDLDLLNESYSSQDSNNRNLHVYNMQTDLIELKKYLATFLEFYDSMQGSFGDNLLDVGDIEQIYSLFHDQLEAIKQIKNPTPNKIDAVNKQEHLKVEIKKMADNIRTSYEKLSFRIDPIAMKNVLDTTLVNTEKLKPVYKHVNQKVTTVLSDLLAFQNNLMRQTGNVYSAFSGETLSEMILLIDAYEDRIHNLKSQISLINNTKNKLNNLLKGFSNINGIFGGYNIYNAGNYQIDQNTEIVNMSNEIRQSVITSLQIVQLRYDNAYRYLDVLSSIRDLILSVTAINNKRNSFFN